VDWCFDLWNGRRRDRRWLGGVRFLAETRQAERCHLLVASCDIVLVTDQQRRAASEGEFCHSWQFADRVFNR
jgi:hypothetical protein